MLSSEMTRARTIEDFREALSRFASGVTIVTALDSNERPRGFTASAFCSVSLEPPLVLVCLAATADCHSIFRPGLRYAIHILQADQDALALRFGQRRHDKFEGVDIGSDEDGLPSLAKSLVRLSCRLQTVHEGGDHSILVGSVESVSIGEGMPAVYYNRHFWSMAGPTSGELDMERYNLWLIA
jgi:flavin reductase ActVB